MIMRFLLAGVLASAAAGAVAQTPASGPSRPIPYSQLEAYRAASQSVRASRDWWSEGAAGASASATAPRAGRAAANPPVGDGRSLPAATTPALDSGPQSNEATVSSAAEAGTLDTTPPARPKR
jgi:hypothetical protein